MGGAWPHAASCILPTVPPTGNPAHMLCFLLFCLIYFDFVMPSRLNILWLGLALGELGLAACGGGEVLESQTGLLLGHGSGLLGAGYLVGLWDHVSKDSLRRSRRITHGGLSSSVSDSGHVGVNGVLGNVTFSLARHVGVWWFVWGLMWWWLVMFGYGVS